MLFTIIIANPEQLDWKIELMIYNLAFIEIDNWCNGKQVHGTHGIIIDKK